VLLGDQVVALLPLIDLHDQVVLALLDKVTMVEVK
jgi:hypothetical protein